MVNVMEEFFWGLSLDAEHTTEKFSPEEKPKADKNCSGLHILVLKQALLGPEAADGEVNVIEVETTGYEYSLQKTTLAVLKGGEQSTHHANLDVTFCRLPLTFTLTSGKGPVHLMGRYHKYYSVPLCDEFGNATLAEDTATMDEIVDQGMMRHRG